MVIKHPNSKDTEARIFSFEDYYDPDPPAVSTSSHSNDTINDNDIDNVETHQRLPWRPFRSRVDFELAEHMQGTNLNRNEIESLLKIIQKIIDSPNQFTIRSFVDLTKAWTLARDVNSSTGVSLIILLMIWIELTKLPTVSNKDIWTRISRWDPIFWRMDATPVELVSRTSPQPRVDQRIYMGRTTTFKVQRRQICAVHRWTMDRRWVVGVSGEIWPHDTLKQQAQPLQWYIVTAFHFERSGSSPILHPTLGR